MMEATMEIFVHHDMVLLVPIVIVNVKISRFRDDIVVMH